MATQIQFRRGTAAQHSSFTGATAEVTVNTTNKSIHVHDGTTAGWFELAKADLSNTSSLSLSGLTTISSLKVSNDLYVSGVSTFVGDVYIGGDLYIKDDLVFDEFNARNANISGILTVGQSIYYSISQPYGVAYFDSNTQLVSTGTTSSAISETNYILSTNSSGVPSWSNVIDGGSY